METEKSHNLPSARWRPREVGGVIQSKSESLRNRRLDGVNPSARVKEDEMKCSSSSTEGEKKGHFSPSCFLFHSDLPWIGETPLTLGRAIYFTEFSNSNANHTQKQCVTRYLGIP